MFIAEKLRRRVRDEEGGIMVFIIMMFLTMIVAGGMAVDFMRHETARADLQNALDRGVLALTATSQTAVDKSDQDQLEGLVRSYMASSVFIPIGDAYLSVPPDTTDDSTIRYEAVAHYDMPTYFLKLIGINSIRVRADTVAMDGFRDVEIAVVLDLSISMNNSKLNNLKIAAGDFVHDMLDEEGKREKTMISIVPYSSQVGMPFAMAAHYNIRGPVHPELQVTDGDGNVTYNMHGYGAGVCLDFDIGNPSQTNSGDLVYQGDFNVVEIDPAVEHVQSQAFFINQGQNCHSSNNLIKPFSNNPQLLEDYIDGLSQEFSTATYLGVKWGMALLQPSSASVLQGMADAGALDPGYDGTQGVASLFDDGTWPRDKSTYSVQKVMVLMTDGENRSIYRVPDNTYDDKSLANWTCWGCGPNTNSNTIQIIDDFNGARDSNNDGVRDGDTLQRAACDAAKAAGIDIYTIGFELSGVQPRAVETLEYCASGPLGEYHFLVDGLDIADAFDKIAARVNGVKLVN